MILEHTWNPAQAYTPPTYQDFASLPQGSILFISGPIGSGKSYKARKLHENWQKQKKTGGKLVEVNVNAVPEKLIESELFGHVKGAFTGAINNKEGKFVEANNGTLFLDEIGDLPPYLQTKLLSVLGNHQVKNHSIYRDVVPVGTSKLTSTNATIICATHHNLDDLVKAGQFRPDLKSRLESHELRIEPIHKDPVAAALVFFENLNEKGSLYVPPETSQEFRFDLERHATIKLLKAIQNGSWEGNRRDFEQIADRLLLYWSNKKKLKESKAQKARGEVIIRENMLEEILEAKSTNWGQDSVKQMPDIPAVDDALNKKLAPVPEFKKLDGLSKLEALYLLEAKKAHPNNNAKAMRHLKDKGMFCPAGSSTNLSGQFGNKWKKYPWLEKYV